MAAGAPSAKALEKAVHDVLSKVEDMDNTTPKNVRHILERQYGHSLKDRKNELLDYMAEFMARAEQAAVEGAPARNSPPAARRGKAYVLLPKAARFLGQESATRGEVTEMLWARVKGSCEKGSKGTYTLSQELADLLGRKTISFTTMSRAIEPLLMGQVAEAEEADDPGAHAALFDGLEQLEQAEDEKPAGRSTGKKRPRAAAGGSGSGKSNRSTRRAAKAGDVDDNDDEPKPTKLTGFFKPFKLSPAMQAVAGVPVSSRSQLTKLAWAYIREHGLQDPDDGRKINCDDTFMGISGGKKVITSFQLAKLFGPHLAELDGDEMERYTAEVRAADEARGVRFDENGQWVGQASGSKKRKKAKKPQTLEHRIGSLGKGINKPRRVTGHLHALTGQEVMSRPQIAKAINQYAKKNGLVEGNKYNCDAKLKAVCGGEKHVTMFSVNKYLGAFLEEASPQEVEAWVRAETARLTQEMN